MLSLVAGRTYRLRARRALRRVSPEPLAEAERFALLLCVRGTIQRSGPDLRSMTGAATAVRDGTIGSGHEVPLVAVRQECQLENAVLAADLPLAVWFARHKSIVGVDAARADDELADAASRIAAAVGCLRGKPFIEMIVAVHHDLGAGVVKNLEKIPHPLIIAVLARREERMVPVGERASVGVRRQIGLQPRALRRSGTDAHAKLVVAVQRNEMPRPKIETVVTEAVRTRR